jgi:rubrerythrin
MLFVSLLQGCPWQNCSNLGTFTETVSLTQDEVDQLGGTAPDTDSIDTGPGTDPASLTCEDVCAGNGADLLDCELLEPPAERFVVSARCHMQEICIGGRLHEVITTRARATGPDAVATWLAQMAHDEAASVIAFRELARELAAHGAPSPLIARIRAAAHDEVRHARQIRGLAVSRGGVVPRVERSAPKRRDLFGIALENTVEAVVTETWSAMRAWHQAAHAADPALREVMRTIAEDETRHAELARDIDGWLRGQLSAADGARLTRARASAVQALFSAEGAQRIPAAAASTLGLPSPEAATHLLHGLRAALWST